MPLRGQRCESASAHCMGVHLRACTRPPARMHLCELLKVRLPAWADWFALLAMAFAAPMVAICVHSAWVFYTGFRVYNAEIGGAYFLPGSGGRGPPMSSIAHHLVVLCLVLALPTFLVLLPFRRLALERWMLWAYFIFFWLCMAFHAEVAYR